MKKKLTGLILSFAILLNMSALSVYASGESYDAARLEKAKNLLAVTEIMELPDDQVQYMQTLSRAEFAVYLANAFGIDSAQKNANRYYIDVPMDHWALNSINFLYERGILTMNDSHTFLPDEIVTKDEAYKMVIEAVGYGEYAENKGGFPAGYRWVAERIDILEGISNAETLNVADTAILLANMLVTPMLEGFEYTEDSVSYTNENTANILEVYHNIYVIDAQVTGVPGISFAGVEIPVGKMMLGNEFYDYSISNLYDYIGYQVRAYCKRTDRSGNGGDIVLLEDRGKTKKIAIAKENFINFDPIGYEIKYWEGDRQRSVSVTKGINVLKNGMASNNNISNVFNINKGRIEILDTDDNNVFDCALIWEYRNILVSYVDVERETIYDKQHTGMPLEYGLSKKDVLRIFDEKGKPASAGDIKANTLLTIYESANYLEIHICPVGKEQTISGYTASGANGPQATLTDAAGNKQAASFDVDYFAANSAQIAVGMTGVFYYDLYGKIAYIDKNRKDNIKFGFIMGYREEGTFGATVQLKLLTEANTHTVLECNNKVEIDGAVKDTNAKIYAALRLGEPNISGQAIAYKQNSEGKIIAIDTVATGGSLQQTTTGNKERFSYTSKSFGALTVINADTVCFGIPENLASATDEDYFILPIDWFEEGEESAKKYTFTAYKMDKDSGYEDILVCERRAEQDNKEIKSMFIVEEIYEVLNEEGFSVECVEGYTNGIQYTYKVREGVSLAKKGIEKGDILYLKLDPRGDIGDCTSLYDYNQKKLLGTWNNNEYNNLSFNNSNYVAHGEVLSTRDGVLKIDRGMKNQVTNEYEYDGVADLVAPCGNVPITLCDEENGKFICSLGRQEDIVGSDVSATEYAKVFIKMSYGTVKEIVIYK